MIKKATYAELEKRIQELEQTESRHKRTYEALKESEERLRVLSDASFEAIFLSEKGICFDQNQAAERIFGYTRDEAVGKNGTEWVVPENRKQVKDYMLSDYGELYEATALRKDGTTFPCEIQGRRISYQGRPVRITALRDITERKRAEEELLKSEALYSALIGAIPDPVVVYDSEGRATYVNDAFVQVYGWSRESLLGGKIDFVPPEETEATQEALRRTLEDGTVFFETKRWNINGDLLDIQLRTALLHDQEGKHVLSIVIHRDVTALKQAERALRKAHDELEVRVEKRTAELAKANEELCVKIAEVKQTQEEKLALERQVRHAQKLESLGVLAGGIAHDFNNILMAILGNADIALDELSPMSPARRNLQAIVKASKRASELSKQMLAYSGKGRFFLEPIDIGGLLEEISHLLEVSISKKSVLKLNLTENLPTFEGDVTQIRQLIMNLITNSSEAIGDKNGVITLSTGATNCDRVYLDDTNEVVLAGLDPPSEGIYTYIEVADTGCGMNAGTIEKIFDPFFTTKTMGRGLGLSAVLGIVRGHRGTLKIHSEAGKGTRFKVLFPADESLDNGFAARRKDEAGGKDWCGSGTVLIVDDEETVCTVGKQMLERMGFSVLTASDGREALKVFSDHPDEFVCVLLDLSMPHMDGEEAFREMRRLHPNATIILSSGYNKKDAIQRFGDKGLSGFIQKPYSMTALREKLMEVLYNKRISPNGKGQVA